MKVSLPQAVKLMRRCTVSALTMRNVVCDCSQEIIERLGSTQNRITSIQWWSLKKFAAGSGMREAKSHRVQRESR